MRSPKLVLLALPLLLLTACGPAEPAPSDDSPSSSATPKPTESVTPVVTLAPDALLVVNARVTADNGAVLDLSMTVHQSTAWSDGTASDLPALMTAGCEGSLDETVYEGNLWSFTRIDVVATSSGSVTWPSDKRLRLFPTVNGDVSLASDGFLVDDPDVDPATPHCARDRYLYGSGTGTLVAGIQGDTDEVGAAGQFTRWANQLYGFVAQEVAGQTAAEAGMTVSDCSYVVTDAGTALNGGASWWGERITESNCYVGSFS